jgi:hypothetical protein
MPLYIPKLDANCQYNLPFWGLVEWEEGKKNKKNRENSVRKSENFHIIHCPISKFQILSMY